MQNSMWGIVLRHLPGSSHKVSLLTAQWGKITALIFEQRVIQRLKAGTLIEMYDIKQQGNMFLLKAVSIVSIPLTKTSQDFYWIQHLLELCYYFLPLHEPLEEIFILLQHCFALTSVDHAKVSGWPTFKKKIIGVFLITFGFTPPDELKLPLYTMKNSLLEFIDFEPEQKVEFVIKTMREAHRLSLKSLDTWLIACIQTHPRMSAFKTLHFAYKPIKTV